MELFIQKNEANSIEEAREMALKKSGDIVCLCHQYSRKIS